jgi:hypothetical protein
MPQNILKTSSKFLTHCRIYNWVQATVKKSTKVSYKHGEDEVTLSKKTFLLKLTYHTHQILWRPGYNESDCYNNNHTGNLKVYENKILLIKTFIKILLKHTPFCFAKTWSDNVYKRYTFFVKSILTIHNTLSKLTKSLLQLYLIVIE